MALYRYKQYKHSCKCKTITNTLTNIIIKTYKKWIVNSLFVEYDIDLNISAPLNAELNTFSVATYLKKTIKKNKLNSGLDLLCVVRRLPHDGE